MEIDINDSKDTISRVSSALSQISSSRYSYYETSEYYIVVVLDRLGEVIEGGIIGKYYSPNDIEDEIAVEMANDILKYRRK